MDFIAPIMVEAKGPCQGEKKSFFPAEKKGGGKARRPERLRCARA
jgi:hypothetical protein